VVSFILSGIVESSNINRTDWYRTGFIDEPERLSRQAVPYPLTVAAVAMLLFTPCGRSEQYHHFRMESEQALRVFHSDGGYCHVITIFDGLGAGLAPYREVYSTESFIFVSGSSQTRRARVDSDQQVKVVKRYDSVVAVVVAISRQESYN
jgi:hypothetical protein